MAPVTVSKIATVTLSSNSSTIDFTNIPQIYTDLKLVCSLRSTRATYTNDDFFVNINGLTTNQSNRYIQGNGSGVASATSSRWGGLIPADGSTTASVFGSAEVYIPNYTSSNYKSSSLESVNENNATESYMIIKANLWSSVDAITRLTLVCADGNFKPYSTATLYGIKSLERSAYASGGEVSEIGGYYIHTFKGNGTFTPTVPLSVEYLLVGGGGSGGCRPNGFYPAGGGGGGGVLTGTTSVSSQNYSITIGSGGNGVSTDVNGNPGGSTTAFGLTAIGGGYGARVGTSGGPGGSGGGAAGSDNTNGPSSNYGANGGAGTAGQGNNGGYGWSDPSNTLLRAGGGGGGAGAAGGNATNGTAGSGGIGIASSISGASTYYGGGGGGCIAGNSSNHGAGGLGGGTAGNYGNSNSATANTGGGSGGASGGSSGNGGSGIVIIRYRK